MLSVSIISKWKRFLQRLRCEFKEGHTWMVLFSAQRPNGVTNDVLLECQKCGKRIWISALTRPTRGQIFEEIKQPCKES